MLSLLWLWIPHSGWWHFMKSKGSKRRATELYTNPKGLGWIKHKIENTACLFLIRFHAHNLCPTRTAVLDTIFSPLDVQVHLGVNQHSVNLPYLSRSTTIGRPLACLFVYQFIFFKSSNPILKFIVGTWTLQ